MEVSMSDKDATEQIAAVVIAIVTMMKLRGRIAVDFIDVEVGLKDLEEQKPQRGFVGHGEASGEGRAVRAAEMALADLERNMADGR
jgi:cell division GTPase FtsZ